MSDIKQPVHIVLYSSQIRKSMRTWQQSFTDAEIDGAIEDRPSLINGYFVDDGTGYGDWEVTVYATDASEAIAIGHEAIYRYILSPQSGIELPFR